MHLKLLSGSILLLTLAAAPAWATNYFPSTTQDQFGEDLDDCSLREAIQAASTDAPFGGCPAGSVLDVIDLSTYLSPYHITRAGAGEDDNATGDFDFSGTGVIILQGAAAQRSMISGNQIDRIIDVDIASNIQVYLLDLTLADGDAGNQPGGAVRARGDLMVIQRTHVTHSRGGSGGGVYASSTANEVIIRDSSITRNRAAGAGGGVYSAAEEMLRVTNATFSENYAAGEGGGLTTTGPVSLKSVTIAYNSGDSHGGAYITGTPATIDNSIFSNNTREFSTFGAADLYCTVTVTSLGYNMYQDRDCPFLVNWVSDVQDDPLLGTLVDAGQGVPVHPLMPDSPAIDSGGELPNDGSSGNCVSTDQRRFSRNRCDRGAYEEYYHFNVTREYDAPDANPGNGVCESTLGGCTLRAALQESATAEEPRIIEVRAGTYEINIPGRDENLGATGDLDIIGPGNSARVLIGHGPDQTIVRSNGSDRVFDSRGSSLSNAPIGLYGMRITGGMTTNVGNDVGDGGGVRLYSRPNTTLDQVWIDRNQSARNGGGLHVLGQADDVVRITRSAFTRNQAANDGGGAYLSQGDPLYVRNSTFSDNHADHIGGGLRVSLGEEINLAFVTVTGNSADNNGGGMGITSSTILSAVIAAGNSTFGGDPDCNTQLGVSALSTGYNLIGDPGSSGCQMAGDLTGNQLDVDVMLSPTSLIGTTTPYASVHPGSPAQDVIPAWRCETIEGLYQRSDQHDRPRPGDDPYPALCTAGAIEAVSDLIFASRIDDSYVGE